MSTELTPAENRCHHWALSVRVDTNGRVNFSEPLRDAGSSRLE